MSDSSTENKPLTSVQYADSDDVSVTDRSHLVSPGLTCHNTQLCPLCLLSSDMSVSKSASMSDR